MINEKHLRLELPPEEYWPCSSVSSETTDHLSLSRLRPVSITSRIGLLCLQAQRSRNVFRSKYSRSIINTETKLQRTRRSPGGHRIVELKHHPGIVELSRRHERQKGIMLNQSHEVPKPGVSGQGRDVVIRLSMEFSGVESDVPRNRGPNEKWSPDPRGRK